MLILGKQLFSCRLYGLRKYKNRLKGMRRLLKAFKTEIVPTEEQKGKIVCSIGVARFLYNQYIACNRRLYKMYQCGLLDAGQKHFVTANEFDKHVNHKLKKNCRGLIYAVQRLARKPW